MSTNVFAHVHIPTSLTIRLCVVFHALGRAGFRWSQTTTSGDAHNAPSGGNRAVCVPTQKCGCALVYIYSDRGLCFYAVHVCLSKSVGRRYRAQRINVNIVVASVLSSGNTWQKGLWIMNPKILFWFQMIGTADDSSFIYSRRTFSWTKTEIQYLQVRICFTSGRKWRLY